MIPAEPLDPESARQSALFGKVVFLIATAGTGAEVLVRALGELSGVAAIPVPTLLFSLGMHRVLEHWYDDDTGQGLHALVTEAEYVLGARLLADEALLAARRVLGGDIIVEYTADHMLTLDDIKLLYPDATMVHVVRDGRDVAERLSQTKAVPPVLPPRFAARRWVDDQRAVLDASLDGMVRLETLMADPHGSLAKLADALGIETDGATLAAAAAHFRGAEQLLTAGRTGRAGAIVEIVAPDLLLQFGYQLRGSSRSARAAAWAEIAGTGAVITAAGAGRRVLHAASSRFGIEAWRPWTPPS
jgi:hypothetical protein